MFLAQQLVYVSLLCGGLLFQNQTPASEAAATGSISGVVRDSISGAPKPNVNISAAGVSTTTDSQGNYTLRGLKPGRVQISATVQGAPLPTIKAVGLLGGQDLTGADIRVPSMASISGRITGEDEKPLAGITVWLVGKEYAFGALRYIYSGSATTDEGGRYALRRVPPARGFLLLARKEAATLKPVSAAPADLNMREPVLAPAYYPGVTAMEAAVPLILGPGENREHVDMKMPRSPSYCIEGTVRSATGSSPVEFGISEAQPVGMNGLSLLDIQTSRGAEFVNRSGSSPHGRAGADGKIRVCDLHPGSYELSSDSRDGFGIRTATISDHDVGDVLVVAEPAVPVSGEIVWDGAAPGTPNSDGIRILYGQARTNMLVPVGAPIPGAFKFRTPIFKDDYVLGVVGLPAGAYLKDITYGGHSIMNALFHPGAAAEPAVVRFVVARDGGRVMVNVADGEGKPVNDADVVAMPAGADSEAALASVLVWGRTDPKGAWTSEAIPPGKYYLIAGYVPVDRSAESIGKLWRARTKSEAQEIEIGPGAVVSVRLSPTGVE
jgi:protocatechuate 3,4-dioxygenase beta subunit